MSEKSSNLVYLYVWDGESVPLRYMSWYVLNKETGECLKDENLSDYNFPKHSACCILNSKIYVIGGQHTYLYYDPSCLHPPMNQVLIFDTKDDKKWKTGKKMNGSRAFSVVVPLPRLGNKGRIYVFGCDGFGYAAILPPEALGIPPWAEYYDAECDEWIQLPDPPAGFLERSFHKRITGSAVYGTHKILLWSQRCFAIFDALEGLWHPCFVQAPLERCPKWEFKSIYSTKVVVYHDKRTLLWFYGSEFLAYDLLENKPYENSVFSFQDNQESTSLTGPNFELWKDSVMSHFLVVTGKDQLCLIWYDSHEGRCRDDGSNRSNFAIHSIKFQIRKSSSGGLVLKPLQGSPSSERVDGFMIMFAGTLWQDDESNFDFDGSGPQSSSLSDVLEKLPRTMYDLNYGIYLDFKWDKVTKTLTGPEPKEKVSLETFLEKQGLEKYIKIFHEEEITFSALRKLRCNDFKDLDIPASSRRKLRLALQDLGYGIEIGIYRQPVKRPLERGDPARVFTVRLKYSRYDLCKEASDTVIRPIIS